MDPDNTCRNPISEVFVSRLPQLEKQLLVKGAIKCINSEVIDCPCGYQFMSDGLAGVIDCLSCKQNSFCGKCREKSHPGILCVPKEVKKDEDYTNLEKDSNGYKCPNKLCPDPMIIFRDEGCAKVKCPRCNHFLCDCCGEDITKEGYNHFCWDSKYCTRPFCKHCNMNGAHGSTKNGGPVTAQKVKNVEDQMVEDERLAFRLVLQVLIDGNENGV